MVKQHGFQCNRNQHYVVIMYINFNALSTYAKESHAYLNALIDCSWDVYTEQVAVYNCL